MIAVTVVSATQEQPKENATQGPERQSGRMPMFDQQLQAKAGM
jgi:hypothetical protein